MKSCIPVLIACILFACSNGKEDPPSYEMAPAYDTLIDQVKSQAAPRISRTSMGKIDWLAFPHAEAGLIRAIMLRSVNNNDTLPSDTLSSYFFYDFNDLDSLFLFTIVRCDRSGFSSMYHFTFDKQKHRLHSCTLIGSSRNTKGYRTNDKLTYAKDGRSLVVNASSQIVEGNQVIEDNCSMRYDFHKDATTSKLLHNSHREKPLTADHGL